MPLMPVAVPLLVATVHASKYFELNSAIDDWSGQAFMSPAMMRFSAKPEAHRVTSRACVNRIV